MRIRSETPSLVVETPAKLNLFLEVLGKRPDGYHELETVMVSIGLYDTLRFSPRESSEVCLSCHTLTEPQLSGTALAAGLVGQIDSPATNAVPVREDDESLPVDNRNLVLKAAQRLKQVTGTKLGASIELWKRIPVASGLGGGSSDAAATLVALNQLWNLGQTSTDLHELAAQLGSDVNFFLDSHPLALCSGRGEAIQPRPVAGPLHFVVVRPPSGLSTAQVFSRWKPAQSVRSSENLLRNLAEGRMPEAAETVWNALETPARELNADVSRTLKLLSEQPVWSSRMSGSGTACFAWCANRAQAQSVAQHLRAQGAGRVWAVEGRI